MLALVAGQVCAAQEQTPAAGKTAANAPEISSRQETPTFKVRVDLVPVRVVVRNGKGATIGTLKQGDFEVFDNGKPQTITKFSVESSSSPPLRLETANALEVMPAAAPPPKTGLPEQYTALLFDDVHLELADVLRTRQAAAQYIDGLPAADRTAIFTTSGRTSVDFTDERAQLHDALLRLQANPVVGSEQDPCPDVDYYVADLIQNRQDSRALNAAAQDAFVCAFPGGDGGTPQQRAQMWNAAVELARAAAMRQLNIGGHETRLALNTLEKVIRRMASLPGQRQIVLVSPGFLTPDDHVLATQVMDGAVRANVVISALDGRGLYAMEPFGGITRSRPPATAFSGGVLAQYRMDAASSQADIMGELAEATGGTFVHNSNDLAGGFQRTAAAPEIYYLLAYSPQNFKTDGKFHRIEVKLKVRGDYRVQARRGYWAPKKAANPEEEAHQEIEAALFSRDETRDLPIELHTQFFKTTDMNARLSVLAHLDLKGFHFEKREGRDYNELTIVSGLFDRNGRFLKAEEKVLTMRLREGTLENRLQSGVTLKSSFDVEPGLYLLRLVVRDAGGVMAATSDAVEIP